MNDLPRVGGNCVTSYQDEDGPGFLWECPCGSWQLTLLERDRGQFVAEGRTLAEAVDKTLRAENEAIEDAMWGHEATCEPLQHLALQAGLVRPENYSPYIWPPDILEIVLAFRADQAVPLDTVIAQPLPKQLKVEYEIPGCLMLDGVTPCISKAYIDVEISDGRWVGTDKYTVEPVEVQYDAHTNVWRQVT